MNSDLTSYSVTVSNTLHEIERIMRVIYMRFDENFFTFMAIDKDNVSE